MPAEPQNVVAAEFVAKIREFIADVAPEDLYEFEAELGAALDEGDGDHADPGIRQVVLRWAGEGVLRADPLTDQEQAALERFRAGDSRGLLVREPDGTWRTL